MTPLLETRGVWQRFSGLIANSDVAIAVTSPQSTAMVSNSRLRSVSGWSWGLLCRRPQAVSYRARWRFSRITFRVARLYPGSAGRLT